MNILTQFQQVTGCQDISVATHYLSRNNQFLNDAINDFFANNETHNTFSYSNQNLISNIFSKYAEPDDPERIDIEGTIQYFNDLGIDAETDTAALIAAYILQSPSTGVFLRPDFVQNWLKVQTKVDSIEEMSSYLHQCKQDSELMKSVYKYAFKYALDEGEKKLELDAAIDLWKVFFHQDYINLAQSGEHSTATKFIDDFLLAGVIPDKKQISKDEWEMEYSFFHYPLAELENHSTAAAWPLLMDDFVDFLYRRL